MRLKRERPVAELGGGVLVLVLSLILVLILGLVLIWGEKNSLDR